MANVCMEIDDQLDYRLATPWNEVATVESLLANLARTFEFALPS